MATTAFFICFAFLGIFSTASSLTCYQCGGISTNYPSCDSPRTTNCLNIRNPVCARTKVTYGTTTVIVRDCTPVATVNSDLTNCVTAGSGACQGDVQVCNTDLCNNGVARQTVLPFFILVVAFLTLMFR